MFGLSNGRWGAARSAFDQPPTNPHRTPSPTPNHHHHPPKPPPKLCRAARAGGPEGDIPPGGLRRQVHVALQVLGAVHVLESWRSGRGAVGRWHVPRGACVRARRRQACNGDPLPLRRIPCSAFRKHCKGIKCIAPLPPERRRPGETAAAAARMRMRGPSRPLVTPLHLYILLTHNTPMGPARPAAFSPSARARRHHAAHPTVPPPLLPPPPLPPPA